MPVLVLAVVSLAGIVASSLTDASVGSASLATVLLIGGVAGLVLAVLAWILVGRSVSAWHYAEREQDLLVTRGRMYRRLTVIPYGRMQVIEVRANPLSTWLDIATVELVTASASTDAHIPGLPTAEAHALRDRLAAKGEAMTAGL